MMTITKLELTQAVTDGLGLNNREAKEMVEAFFAEIAACLNAGEEVKLAGFGVFNVRDKPERPGRNPKTGIEVPITPRRVLTFRASQMLKDRICAAD